MMSAVVSSRVSRPTRHERAPATRQRITRVAYALFSERGYAETTMAEIAEAAGVAVQTVYFAFHTWWRCWGWTSRSSA
jgi:AcrR family transcriptional regulator